MTGLVGLNNEVDAINRSIYIVDESYLEIKDYVDNGSQAINLYWNMATTALVETVSPTKLKLTQGGKTTILEVVSSNSQVTFNLANNRSTDPVTYFPSATYERKNDGSRMVGFEATIPANALVTFTVTLKDGNEVPPSSVEATNYILLELPNPNTGLEGETLHNDNSEFHVDNSGDVSIGGISTDYAWNVYGYTNANDAFNKKFFLRWSGMKTTNTTTGTNYGGLLSASGIDRSANGELGIRGGASNGIDTNEGFRFGFDASKLPNTVSLQLVKVGVNFVSGSRTGMIVNRSNTALKKSFGGPQSSANVILPSGSGLVNVEDLNINILGGLTNFDLATVFNTGDGNFRINKLVFKIISNNATLSIPAMTTPIVEKKIEKELIVSPNPFTDILTLNNVVKNSGKIRVKLFDISGNCHLDNNYFLTSDKNQINLDLQQLKPGVYTIQIISKNGTVITEKLIKQ